MSEAYFERYIENQMYNHCAFKTTCWNCGRHFFVLRPIHLDTSGSPTEEDKKRLREWDALHYDPPRKTTVLCKGCGMMTAVPYDFHWLWEDMEAKRNVKQ